MIMAENGNITLKQLLRQYTREGELARDLGNGKLECLACGHRCVLGEGRDGICHVRFNRGGKLFVPAGYAAGIALDPVEKKPFFHALPGSKALSFGMLGCDYHCGYCQNWVTSQTLRDPMALAPPTEFLSAAEMVSLALTHKAAIVTSTYNEPLITSEWAVEIFRFAKQHGLVTSYVSNGNGTPEVIDYLRAWVDLYKVDLKGFNDKQYRKLGGVLQRVLDTIRLLHDSHFWVEIVTLIVPGFNDSDGELGDIANFIASVSPDIPWHVTAFHSDYKMEDTANTPVRTLLRAVEIGYTAGLHFVYAGNIPGMVGNYENTLCPHCRAEVVQRRGFRVLANRIVNGTCPKCLKPIPGVWSRPAS